MILILIVFTFLYSPFTFSKNLELVFQAKEVNKSVYMYSEDNGLTFEGIMPSILNRVAKKSNIKISFYHVPSSRVEEYLFTNKLDGSLMNKEWLDNPENFLFTKPFLKYGYFLFSTKAINEKQGYENYLTGKRICTHRSYLYPEYPVLSKLFDENKSIRIDSENDLSMLKMLLKNRCEVTIIDEHTGDWLINNLFKNESLYRSNKPIFNVELTMAFTTQWQPFVKEINNYIDKINKTNEMENIIKEAKAIKY
ncbi:transporter substrate-binding domain-containing protein [Colwellia sp. 1_MG-2023]|uniref:substrate-binding periplasmic protein n=1 Tax=Colwellia sp. 1_MG-2023 TaxID=3062649 RepID=UPI0026E29447|nr:transporter substrate-binding domain-containing protein [Colwellia sp. 1_MG-2023]MDO6445683.1 transporter substrate-binding domain-containing protein [Colwellia sp. 1_MG-2023]